MKVFKFLVALIISPAGSVYMTNLSYRWSGIKLSFGWEGSCHGMSGDGFPFNTYINNYGGWLCPSPINPTAEKLNYIFWFIVILTLILSSNKLFFGKKTGKS